MPYDPGPLTEKVDRRRRVVRRRIISLVITVVILVAIYFWQRDQLQGTGCIVVYAVVLGIPVVWLIVVLIRYLLARRQLAHHSATAPRSGSDRRASRSPAWRRLVRRSRSVAATKPGASAEAPRADDCG